MKKLISILSLIFIANAAFADTAPATYTCKDLYKREIAKKVKSREKLNEAIDSSFLMAGSSAAISLLAGGPVTITISFVWLATNGAIEGIAALPSKSERAIKFAESHDRQFRKLLAKAQKANPAVDEKAIAEIIENGFNSGDFCANDELMTRKEMKHYILSKISNK